MGKRLIITNGDWTTSHEIGESAIVIGRDPSCDLFFVNQKLSRRHARVEPSPDGVKLVDLGSRNGMWMNEERVGERWLQPGDAIRLGGLRIGFEEDTPQLEPESPVIEEATMILPAHGTEKTVALRSGEPIQPAPDPASEPGVDQTVMLAKKSPEPTEPPELEDGSVTVMLARKAPEPPEQEDGSVTVMLAKGPAESGESSATVVLGGSGKTHAGDGEVERTRNFAGEAATLAPHEEAPILVPESEPFVSVVKSQLAQLVKSRWAATRALMFRAAERFALLNWETKFVLVLSGVGLIVTSTLAIIVLRTHSVLVGVLTGLPLIVGWAYSAVVLARHLTVRPVAEIARDVKALSRGEKPAFPSRKAYPELDKLVASINRLAGRQPEPHREDREETD